MSDANDANDANHNNQNNRDNNNNNNNDDNDLWWRAIDDDLHTLEEGLGGHRRTGRAVFESFHTLLTSIRQRLDRHRAPPSALTDRLRTAELAHVLRVPLWRMRQTVVVASSSSGRSSTTTSSPMGQRWHSQAHDDDGEASFSRGASTPDEHNRRSSLLSQFSNSHSRYSLTSSICATVVASRRLSVHLFSGEDITLHEQSTMILSSSYIQRLSIFPPTREDQQQEEKAEPAVAEQQQQQSNQDDPMQVVEDDVNYDNSVDVLQTPSSCSSRHHRRLDETPIMPPLLPQRSINNMAALQRNISGSITVPAQLDGFEFAVFSWGSPTSLHDDDRVRLPAQSRVADDSRVGRLQGVLSVSCGPHHAAYATHQGQVFACGSNASGALDPTRPVEPRLIRPVQLECLGCSTIVRQVSCGWDHTAAITDTGVVLTWGNNQEGQLGHSFSTTSSCTTQFCSPKSLCLGARIRGVSVACGDQFTLVLTSRMSVMACGVPSVAGYTPGRMEPEDPATRRPSELPALVGLPLVFVAAGKDHAVVLTAHGSAYAWGINKSGCCGRGYPNELLSPVPVITPTSQLETPLGTTLFPNWTPNGGAMSLVDDVAVVHAAAGVDHTVLVTRAGTLLVCGSNRKGQLGISGRNVVDRAETVRHPNGGRFTSAEAGDGLTLLRDERGDVWQSTAGGVLERVLEGKNVLTIAAGGQHCVAVAAEKGSLHTFCVDDNAVAKNANLCRSLEGLVGSLEESGDDDLSPSGRELVERTEQLLRYPSVLNGLFMDPSELDHLFATLLKLNDGKLKKALAEVMNSSIEEGLKDLQEKQARMMYPEAVRCLLHYIRFFDLDSEQAIDFDPLGSSIMILCEALLSLPYEGFKALLVWMTLYPRPQFVRMLVKPLLSQLTKALDMKISEDGVIHAKVARRAVPLIISVLRWLHRASERANIATPEDFYSEAVQKIPLEMLYEDLRAFKTAQRQKKSPPAFLICDSPFLIPPTKKRDLLQMESQVNMMKTAGEEGRITILPNGVSINPFHVLEVERSNLLGQTLAKIKAADPKELRLKLRVKFTGEDGVDAGGVTREFFQLVSAELFDSHSGLWTQRFGDNVTWFNSDCTWDEEGYELVGVLVGLALYNGVLLDVHFPPAVYRKLLDLPLGLEDLVDVDIRKGMQQLLDYTGNDVEEVFCLSFAVTWMEMGQERKVELKPGGSDIPVTSFNKEEYVLLYVKWLLVDSIQPQWNAFHKGVLRIMESSSLDLFRPEELELLVVGSPELDFGALQENAVYEGGYDANSAVVQNLWKFLRNNANRQTQEQFLQFTTGSTKAPIGGLAALPFKVQRAGVDSDQLPTSHTCFHTLLLPDYGDNYEKLAERLGRAIVECEGFGLE